MTDSVAPHRARWDDLDPATLYDLLRLRVEVFVVEQACPYPELDGRDDEPGTEHWWFADERGATSYLRVLSDPDGAVRVGRVVTRADARGRGLSRSLLEQVLAVHGHRSVVLSAQVTVAGLYASLGFVATGEEYLDDGIPHLPMRRDPVP